jgi:hypothetical protein
LKKLDVLLFIDAGVVMQFHPVELNMHDVVTLDSVLEFELIAYSCTFNSKKAKGSPEMPIEWYEVIEDFLKVQQTARIAVSLNDPS